MNVIRKAVYNFYDEVWFDLLKRWRYRKMWLVC